MPAPQIVLDLVERFERNRDAYKSTAYNKTQLHREFLDPFFYAVGSSNWRNPGPTMTRPLSSASSTPPIC